MVDTKFIGKKYGPVVYEVGREKLKEYARAVGEVNPLYLDDAKAKASAYGDIVAAPLFVVVYAVGIASDCLLDSEMRLNLMMLLHGEQEFEFGVVVRPRDVITTEGFIKNIVNKEKIDVVTLETTSKNQKGEMTAVGTWTFVIRHG